MSLFYSLLITVLTLGSGGIAWAGGSASASQHGTQIVVTGVGLTREPAIRNALRAAVERGLGGRWASSTEVRNGKLSHQYAHLYCDGFVDTYELLDEKSTDDGVWVTIRATVRVGHSGKLTGSAVDGRQILALAETEQARFRTAHLVWSGELAHWAERVAEVRPIKTVPHGIQEENDTVDLTQTLQITIDQTRFRQITRALISPLEKIADARGHFSARMVKEINPHNLQLWQTARRDNAPSGGGPDWLEFGTSRTCRGVRFAAKGDNLMDSVRDDMKSIIVFVQTSASHPDTWESWSWYRIPVTSSFQLPQTELELTLKDENGTVVHREITPTGRLIPGCSYQPQTFGRAIPSLVIAPAWVAHSATTSSQESLISTPKVTVAVQLKVAARQVTCIRRIESQLKTAPPWVMDQEVTSYP